MRDLAYITNGHERNKLDLFLPAQGKNWPLIVAVHGGAWRTGGKESEPAGVFVAAGFAVAAINYRLSQHAVFPAQIEDCKAAVRWLRAHAASMATTRRASAPGELGRRAPRGPARHAGDVQGIRRRRRTSDSPAGAGGG